MAKKKKGKKDKDGKDAAQKPVNNAAATAISENVNRLREMKLIEGREKGRRLFHEVPNPPPSLTPPFPPLPLSINFERFLVGLFCTGFSGVYWEVVGLFSA